MSELLRVLTDEAVDDDALQAAAAAAGAVLDAHGVDTEGVAPVRHEQAAAAGERAIDEALAGDGPDLELILSPIHGDSRRLQIAPNPDPGAPFLLSKSRYTGCAWDPTGTEGLTRVEIDGTEWHEADRDGAARSYRGP